MTQNTDLWVTKSSSTQQTGFSLLGVVIGLLFSIGFRHFDGPGFTNSLAGFLLGLLILIISIAALLMGGKQIITVDARASQIILEGISRFGSKKRVLFFKEIKKFYVNELGDKEGGSIQYYVVAELKTGERVSLFVGFFDGRYDKGKMETYCQKLKEYLSLINAS